MIEEIVRTNGVDRLNNLLQLGREVSKDYIEARRTDVEQLRKLIIQIVILSIAVIGFSVPIFDKTEIIQNKILFLTALCSLAFGAVFGLWYISLTIENSIFRAKEAFKKLRLDISEAIKTEKAYIQNPHLFEDYQKQMQELADIIKARPSEELKRDKSLYFLLTIFTLAISLIILSMF